MKNIILGLLVGLILGLPISAYAKIIMNPIERVGAISAGSLYTTKVTTEEGTYRIFVYNSGYGTGITTVKIK